LLRTQFCTQTKFRVTVPEAIRRLDLQSKVDEYFHRMRAVEPDRFAGAWIEHVPAFTAVVAFTGTTDGLGTVFEFARASRLPTEIRTGKKYSLNELDEGMARLLPILRDASPVVASEIDVQNQVLRVFISGPMESGSASSMHSASSVPIVLEVRAPEIPLHTYGGKKLTLGGEEECTTGFVVLHESGDEGVITAGHCTNSMVYC